MRKHILIFIILSSFQIINAQSYLALVDSADFYIKNENWVKAESNILSALKAEPANHNNSLLLSNLATIQRYQKRNSEALNNYSLALYMTPNAITLLNNRASLYLEMDSVNAAYQDYDKVIKLDDKDIESRYYHGMIALENGDMITSKQDFDSILKINSKSNEGKEGLALWNKLNCHYDEAIALYNQLLKKAASVPLLTNRAECFLATKQLPAATQDINEALKINATEGYLYLLKARLNKLRYENEEAINNGKLAVKYGINKTIV
ncbi:MAG: hypothetical protein RSA66_10765, partial [Muribaculaceae bacterium]